MQKTRDIFQGYRDPRHVVLITLATIVFAFVTYQVVTAEIVDSFDAEIFKFIHHIPSDISFVFFIITQLGSLASVLVWILIARAISSWRASVITTVSILSAWIGAKIAKLLFERGRPQDIIEGFTSPDFEKFSGFGYPSGHASLAAAGALSLYLIAPRKYRKYLLLIAFLVGISRIVLGGHFPRDIIGGWMLGVIFASLASLAIGIRRIRPQEKYIVSKLNSRGISAVSAEYLDADAKGSLPMVVSGENHDYIVKIFGNEEHVADWLFKLTLLFRYKNLSPEQTDFQAKHSLEREALNSVWAEKHGVRTPSVISYFKVDSTKFALVYDKISGKTLDEYEGSKIDDTILDDIWTQVLRLHTHNQAHRDLRLANIMLDEKKQVYIIDFDFSILNPAEIDIYRDYNEVLVTSSLKVGAKKAFEAMKRNVNEQQLKNAARHFNTSLLSSTSRSSASGNQAMVDEINELFIHAGIEEDVIGEIEVERFNLKSIVNVVIFGALVYSLFPQLQEFAKSFGLAAQAHIVYVLLAIGASLATYVAAMYTVHFLTHKRYSLKELLLLFIASSFTSKLGPGGVGSAALQIRYLNKKGMGSASASSIIAADRLVGMLAFIVPFSMILLFTGQDLGSIFQFSLSSTLVLVFVGVVAIITTLAFTISSIKDKVKEQLCNAKKTITSYIDKPRILAGAFIASASTTIFYVACLYFSLQAAGVHVALGAVVINYAIAVVARSAAPTPGGLGALEAALVIGLTSFGVDKSSAFAAVIIYRLVTYWLPIPFGLAAYRHLQSKKLI